MILHFVPDKWENVLEKVKGCLARWKWIKTKMSYKRLLSLQHVLLCKARQPVNIQMSSSKHTVLNFALFYLRLVSALALVVKLKHYRDTT